MSNSHLKNSKDQRTEGNSIYTPFAVPRTAVRRQRSEMTQGRRRRRVRVRRLQKAKTRKRSSSQQAQRRRLTTTCPPDRRRAPSPAPRRRACWRLRRSAVRRRRRRRGWRRRGGGACSGKSPGAWWARTRRRPCRRPRRRPRASRWTTTCACLAAWAAPPGARTCTPAARCPSSPGCCRRRPSLYVSPWALAIEVRRAHEQEFLEEKKLKSARHARDSSPRQGK